MEPIAGLERLTTTLMRLLHLEPQHGYSLCSSLSAVGFELGDRARVYQILHDLERRLLVTSHWETGDRGPARRVYRLTDAGVRSIDGDVGRGCDQDGHRQPIRLGRLASESSEEDISR